MRKNKLTLLPPLAVPPKSSFCRLISFIPQLSPLAINGHKVAFKIPLRGRWIKTSQWLDELAARAAF
jgi:hypothetical protein